MIEQKFLAAFNQLLAQRDFISDDMQAIIQQLTNTAELDAEKEALQVEMGIVSELIRQVASQNANAALDQAEYNRKYDSLADRFTRRRIGSRRLMWNVPDARDNAGKSKPSGTRYWQMASRSKSSQQSFGTRRLTG